MERGPAKAGPEAREAVVHTGILADIFGPDLVVVALIAVVVLFGGSQLPKLARSLGSASHEFRKGMEEGAGKEATTPGSSGASGTSPSQASSSEPGDSAKQA
jgi:sec-independent protein translocase protein TatA